jgi:hypothetical protein
MEQARRLLQDSPVIQSMQYAVEQQAQILKEDFQTANECSMWMIDDIFGEEALAAKKFIQDVQAGSIFTEDIQHVCNIISDSFQACAALHVHAAAAAIDRHNNNFEYTQQSESLTKMFSELKIFRLELASKSEAIASRDSEIHALRQQLEPLVSDFAASQSLQLELQNAMSENAMLRDRIQKLEIRMVEQPSNIYRQHRESSQPIECLIYIAKVDFKGDGPNQLPLQKDDRIAVFVEDDLGWARGFCNGRLGLFPSIICEKTSQVELVDISAEHASLLKGAFARSMSRRT